jgi:Arc/MetJ-type ribon-helix-helix transcriptional regulator
MARLSFRLSELLVERITQVVQEDGYGSFAAFMRTAIQSELKRREQETNLTRAEQTVAVALERQDQQMKRLGNTLQAHFALTDALARMILHCMPEPPAESMRRHWLARRNATTNC